VTSSPERDVLADALIHGVDEGREPRRAARLGVGVQYGGVDGRQEIASDAVTSR